MIMFPVTTVKMIMVITVITIIKILLIFVFTLYLLLMLVFFLCYMFLSPPNSDCCKILRLLNCPSSHPLHDFNTIINRRVIG